MEQATGNNRMSTIEHNDELTKRACICVCIDTIVQHDKNIEEVQNLYNNVKPALLGRKRGYIHGIVKPGSGIRVQRLER
jgi:hypothetical protein